MVGFSYQYHVTQPLDCTVHTCLTGNPVFCTLVVAPHIARPPLSSSAGKTNARRFTVQGQTSYSAAATAHAHAMGNRSPFTQHHPALSITLHSASVPSFHAYHVQHVQSDEPCMSSDSVDAVRQHSSLAFKIELALLQCCAEVRSLACQKHIQ